MADNYTRDQRHSNTSLLEQLEREMFQKMAPVTAYMIVIMVTGIVGNSLVCYVHGMKMKKSTANSFILWLAVLDLSTCSIGLPMETYDLIYHYTFGMPIFCKIFRFSVYLTTVTSVVTLQFIAVDRYCKICRPLKSSPIRRCRVVVAVSLFSGAIVSWPALVLFGTKKINTPYPGVFGEDCSIDDAMIGTLLPKIYLSVLMLGFFAGATVLIVLYTLIGCTLYKRSQSVIGEIVQPSIKRDPVDTGNVATIANSTRSKESEKRRNFSTSVPMDKKYRLGRTGLIFFTITLIFILSFLPSLVLMTIRAVRKNFPASLSDTEYTLYSFGLRMYFLNNSVNCIIYGFLNPLFRKECAKLWRKVMFGLGKLVCARRDKDGLEPELSRTGTIKSDNDVTEDSLQPV